MRVHAIQTGRVRIKASQVVGRGHGLKRRLAPLIDSEWSAWLPTLAYAIEHRDGVILVDAGASAANKSLPRWHPYFRNAVRFDIEPDEEAGPQLRAIGIGSSDVTRVVLTHLHIDHDGGLAAFPASEILVSPRELQRASGIAGRLRGYLPQRWPKHFDPKPLILDGGAYGPFARSKRLTGDGAVVAVATPGHTPDHLSVIVEDGDKAVFIAGDASYSDATTGSARTKARRRRRWPLSGPSPRRGLRFISRRTIRRRRRGLTSGGRSARLSPSPHARPLRGRLPPPPIWASG